MGPVSFFFHQSLHENGEKTILAPPILDVLETRRSSFLYNKVNFLLSIFIASLRKNIYSVFFDSKKICLQSKLWINYETTSEGHILVCTFRTALFLNSTRELFCRPSTCTKINNCKRSVALLWSKMAFSKDYSAG